MTFDRCRWTQWCSCWTAQNQSIEDIRNFCLVEQARAPSHYQAVLVVIADNQISFPSNWFSYSFFSLSFLDSLNQLKNKCFFHTKSLLFTFSIVIVFRCSFFGFSKKLLIFLVRIGLYTRRFDRLVLRVDFWTCFFLVLLPYKNVSRSLSAYSRCRSNTIYHTHIFICIFLAATWAHEPPIWKYTSTHAIYQIGHRKFIRKICMYSLSFKGRVVLPSLFWHFTWNVFVRASRQRRLGSKNICEQIH